MTLYEIGRRLDRVRLYFIQCHRNPAPRLPDFGGDRQAETRLLCGFIILDDIIDEFSRLRVIIDRLEIMYARQRGILLLSACPSSLSTI